MAWDTIQGDIAASKDVRAASNSKKTKKKTPKQAASASSSSSSDNGDAQQQESSDLSSELSSTSSLSADEDSAKPRTMRNKVLGRLGQRIVSCAECSKPLLEGALLEHMARIHSTDGPDARSNKKPRLDGSLHADDDDDDDDSDASLNEKPSAINNKSDKNGSTPSTAAAHLLSKSQSTPKYTPEPLILDGEGGLGEESNMAAALKRKEKLLKANKAASGSRKGRGPVDVDVQCGVMTDKGVQCQRSLTCKTHSMGAKRAVPGRSGLYDILLSEWQKRNQVGNSSTNASTTKGRQQSNVTNTGSNNNTLGSAATPTSSSVNGTPVTGTSNVKGIGLGGTSSTTNTPSAQQDGSSSVVAAIASATQAASNSATATSSSSALNKLKKSSTTPNSAGSINELSSLGTSATAHMGTKMAGTPSTTGSTLINSKKAKRKKAALAAGGDGSASGSGATAGTGAGGSDDRRWYGEVQGDDEDADEEASEMDVEAEMVLLSVAGAGLRRDSQAKSWLCPPETAKQSISPLTSALAVRNSGMSRFRSALAQALAPAGIM